MNVLPIYHLVSLLSIEKNLTKLKRITVKNKHKKPGLVYY